MRFMDSGPEIGGFGKANDSDDDAMPLIPDLDDVRDEDMQLQVIYLMIRYRTYTSLSYVLHKKAVTYSYLFQFLLGRRRAIRSCQSRSNIQRTGQ